MVTNENDACLIREKIRKAVNSGRCLNRRIIIFGCTPYARDIRDSLKGMGLEVDALIDNNESKIGKLCMGIKVWKPEELFSPLSAEGNIENKGNNLVFIASKYEHEMRSQLKKIGLYDDEIYAIEVEESKKTMDESEENFLANIEETVKGYEIYRNILKKYKSQGMLFLCPYPGTGDIYMAGCYFKKFCAENSIEEYIFCVTGKKCRDVAELFEIENIEVISPHEKDLLLKAWEFYGSEIVKLKPLLHWGWRTKRFLHSDHHPQITFTEMFEYDVYQNKCGTEMRHPNVNRKSGYAKRLFQELGLTRNRTCILAPYAGSFLSEMKKEEWDDIAKFLSKRGFDVCTIGYGEKEPEIEGTKRIQFPYAEAVNVVEYAGLFIGIRSGLCDIISQARGNMLVIYEKGFNASSMSYFGLRNMGLNTKVVEFEYEKNSKKSIEECLLQMINERGRIMDGII